LSGNPVLSIAFTKQEDKPWGCIKQYVGISEKLQKRRFSGVSNVVLAALPKVHGTSHRVLLQK